LTVPRWNLTNDDDEIEKKVGSPSPRPSSVLENVIPLGKCM
jgi:hypothetical protein